MHQEGTAIEYFAGVCVVDRTGQIVSERKMVSEPEAPVALFRDLGLALTRIGLVAGPLSQWLHAGLTAAGFLAAELASCMDSY